MTDHAASPPSDGGRVEGWRGCSVGAAYLFLPVSDVSRGPWKKNGALHFVIRVSDQAATSACSRTSLRRW